ncbi:MAG: hypothetical protein ABR535_02170 [Pyrinomonadaceae bacterium]
MPATNDVLQESQYQFEHPPVGSMPDLDNSSFGDPMAELMHRNRRAFPLPDVLTWADQLLDSLHERHSESPPVVHKKVSPESVLLGSNGRTSLADPEIVLASAEAESEMRYAPLEQVWETLDAASQKVIINSFDERSERILKEPSDARSDVYSLGATLYYLVTAREPVSALERSIEILDGKADPLREPVKIDTNIPAEISDVIMKAMELRRENRYDSAAIMRDMFKSAAARAKSREEAETRELEEAAEELRMAEQIKLDQAQKLADRERQQLEADKQQKSRQLENKLREAEEQKKQAEARAAEAERISREKEEARLEAVALESAEAEKTGVDDGALHLFDTSFHKSDPPQTETVEGVRDVEQEKIASAPAPTVETIKPEKVQTVDTSNEALSFELEEPPKSKMGLVAAAVGGVVAVAIAGGVWMFSSSGTAPQATTTPQRTETQSTQTAAPAPVEAQPEPVEAEIAPETPAQTTTAAAPVVAQKASDKQKKAAQANTAKPAAKKAVTADDLINDY